MQPDVTTLEHRADLRYELLAAGVALLQADTVRLSSERANAIRAGAVRADRAARPDQAFELGVGRGLVLKVALVEDARPRRRSI